MAPIGFPLTQCLNCRCLLSWAAPPEVAWAPAWWIRQGKALCRPCLRIALSSNVEPVEYPGAEGRWYSREELETLFDGFVPFGLQELGGEAGTA